MNPQERPKYRLRRPDTGELYEVSSLGELRDSLDIIGDVYLPKFTRFPSVTNTKNGRTVDVLEIVAEMRSDRWAELTREIRAAAAAGDSERKSALKQKLPVFTPGGVFTQRRNAGLLLPSFIWQLDIDQHLDDPQAVIERILRDPDLDVLMATVSPSGRGVKALLWLPEAMHLADDWPPEQYNRILRDFTNLASAHFEQTRGLKIDTATGAASHPFFLFHSPELFIHASYEISRQT